MGKKSKTYFEQAKKYAKEVIDQGGFKLEPVLMDAYYKDYTTESVFELAGSNISTGLGSKITPWFVPLTKPEDRINLSQGRIKQNPGY